MEHSSCTTIVTNHLMVHTGARPCEWRDFTWVSAVCFQCGQLFILTIVKNHNNLIHYRELNCNSCKLSEIQILIRATTCWLTQAQVHCESYRCDSWRSLEWKICHTENTRQYSYKGQAIVNQKVVILDDCLSIELFATSQSINKYTTICWLTQLQMSLII